MITKADKDNSIIILYQDEYNNKVNEFIFYNLTVANNDITSKLQRDVRNNANEHQQIIQKSDRWKFVNLNPTYPTVRCLVKIHKEGTPLDLL